MKNEGARPIAIAGSGITLLITSSVLVFLRLYARWSKRHTMPDAGDLLLAIGWASATTYTILAIHSSLARDYTDHISRIPVIDDQVKASFYSYIMELFYLFGANCIKISIFIFYHNLALQLGKRTLIWAIRAVLIAVAAFTTISIILPLISCKPIEAQWKQVDPAYKAHFTCMDRSILSLAIGIVNCVIDLGAGIVPLVLIAFFKKPLQAKARFFFLLTLGFLVLAAGIARTILLWEVLDGGDTDWTWAASMVTLAGIWELHLLLVCACGPFICKVQQLLSPKVKNIFTSLKYRCKDEPETSEGSQEQSTSGSFVRRPFTSSEDPIFHFPPAERAQDAEKAALQTPNQPGSKLAGKRKATPTLDLQKPLPTVRKSLESDCEITVAYTPLEQQSMELGQERGTPAGRLEGRHRFSGISWITGGSTNSRWSGLRTPGTDFASHTKSGPASPRSPTYPPSALNYSRSLGLSSIDVSEQLESPTLPDMRRIDPALSPTHVACRACGQYHPYGYRHGQDEMPSDLRFGFWKRGKSNRQTRSTFFDDADVEDDFDSAV